MPPRRDTLITRRDQVASLASPARQEILDVLMRMEEVPLSDVARVLGKPVDGLYYHVRALERVGLVSRGGTRRRNGREEATFRSTAREFAIRVAPSPPAYARSVEAVVASMMRLGIRDFRRALAHPGNVLQGPRRDLWSLRTTGWLAEAEVAEVNRRIDRLRRSVSKPPRTRGRLYAVTILLTPLSHRARKRHSRPRASRRSP